MQIAAAPVPADVPPPPDATQPSNQYTPENALRTLSEAVLADDRQAIAECLCGDGVDPDAAGAGRAFFFAQASQGRLERAWQAKFEVPMDVPGLTLDMFPGRDGTFEALLSGTADFPGGLQVTVDGNMARLRVPLPREELRMPDPSHRLTAMGRWSGATLVFKQVDGNLKLDTDSTFNFVVLASRRPGNTQNDLAIMEKVEMEIADGIDALAADIESGKIASSQPVIIGIEAIARRSFKDARIDGGGFIPLPLIGG